jgi:single-stranded-DNA-specific exonuclease
MLQKKWVRKPSPDIDLQLNLVAEIKNVHPKIAQLLLQKELSELDTIQSFFNPDLSQLHDPFLMEDMQKAVDRLDFAIKNNQRILVYGDYDVDGTSSVALVYSFLSKYTQNLDYYIPDRITEGYGISFKSIDYASDNDFSLIIALDCGIKANDKIEYANQKKIDFIICDHHNPGQEIPNAMAVLDPKRLDCNYPFKELCGCGVGFKLMQAYCLFSEISTDHIFEYIDFLAIAIASDIVPIVGENRIFTYHGLKLINKNPRKGIKAILELCNFTKRLNVSDLVFIIAPRINAAGRLASGNKAVELLISDDTEIALMAGRHIENNNKQRRILDKDITLQALAILDEAENTNAKTSVVYNPEWHKGVIGIVASRLIETHYRPTIVITLSEGKLTGSARSVAGYDVYAAIDSCSEFLEQFGGHKYAAGLTLQPENLLAFKEKFEQIVADTIDEQLLIPCIEIDGELKFSDIFTNSDLDKIILGNEVFPQFYKQLRRFNPFGPGNMNPFFLAENCIAKDITLLSENEHLKFKVFQPENEKLILNAIAFKQANSFSIIDKSKPFSMVFVIEENQWRDHVSLQLRVIDIKAL